MTSGTSQKAVLGWGTTCLGHLAGHPELLGAFLDQTGMSATDLRKGVGTLSLSMGLMDYFAHNEPALLAMCQTAGLKATDFMQTYERANRGG
jgi:uncharacterized protein DUF3572